MEDPIPALNQQNRRLRESFFFWDRFGFRKVFSNSQTRGIKEINPTHSVPNPGAFRPIRIPEDGITHQTLIFCFLERFIDHSLMSCLH